MPKSTLLYTEIDGKPTDAPFHDAILNNPKADKEQAEETIKRVMKEYGLSREEAESIYLDGDEKGHHLDYPD